MGSLRAALPIYRIWHGATFALLAIAVLAGPSGREDRWRPWVAGALAGLAGLSRTEWGIAALLSVLALFLWRGPGPRKAWPGAIVIAGGFLFVFGGVFVLFGAAAGWDALLRDAPVLLLKIPSQTRAEVAFAGLRGWQGGLWQMLYSAGLWLGVFFLTEILSVRNVDPGRARRRLPWLAALLALLALSAWAGGLSGPLLLAAAPLVCAAAVVTGLRARRDPRAAALLGFGTLGLLLSYRRFFYIGDGPYVAPPLLFAFVCAAGLAAMAAVREDSLPARQKLRSGLSVALLLLIGFAFAARFIEYATRETVPIEGTRGLLSARAELAREIAALGETIRQDTRAGDGLVVFPEGEILNFLSRRPNPIRHKLYLPGYVTAENEAEILRELERAAPAAVVVWRRPVGEYGSGLFGEAYGRQIRFWIAEHYAPKPYGATAPAPWPSFEYYLRRAAAR